MKLIYNKISKSIGIIQRVSYNLPTSVLLSLYYTMVHPYYEYCNIIWANVKSKYFEKLSASQRKVFRIVFQLKWNTHIDHLYVKCNILNIFGINTFQMGCFMFKAVNGLLPSYLSNLFITNNNIHSHCTRQHWNHHVIRHNTSIRASSIRICGGQIWNCLDSALKTAPSFNIFRSRFRSFIVANAINLRILFVNYPKKQ